ncbi:MAG TPA: hypothetical protein VKB48_12785 [Candidatus Acidoferrum sp.]|nr:hypothetical protein [Candidatus Acidoferrum sp.]
MDKIQGAIENLYSVFSSFRLRDRIEACKHCHGLKDDQLIRSKILRSLGVDELHHYTWDAMITWGDDYDFRHFLPRILELCALDERLTSQFVDESIVLGKLRYGKWPTWPKAQRQAVRGYLHALWELKLEHQFPWEDFMPSLIEGWICAIAQAEDDLQPYLHRWTVNTSRRAIGNLSHFVVSVWEKVPKGKLRSKRKEQRSQVVNWLSGDSVKAALLNAHRQTLTPVPLKWLDRACACVEPPV